MVRVEFRVCRGLDVFTRPRKWFIIGSVVVAPAQLFINAPFGRFTPSQHSIFLVDGIKSWIVMELVSPIFFLYALFRGQTRSILAGAYLIHYLNRALVSPLRTPSRSKSHLIVPLSAVLFNTLNGSLMGSFISSRIARSPHILLCRPRVWAFGFAAQRRGEGEHYAIPNGLLFNFVSYPNYFCEWLEWLGFALAADPRLAQSFFAGTLFSGRVSRRAFSPACHPPWVFLLAEVLLMFPRAYRGHRWYHDKFGDRYPRERRIVVPFVL
ncbi:hypothetical protein FB451DRAFT_1357444 [Mycena latifolia]|nr:hypothetical protein FB451DRAFT_1357444 [Mycena latifolia]